MLQVPVVEQESERCPDDFPYADHGMRLTVMPNGIKKIFVQVRANICKYYSSENDFFKV
jgi:hypothetical protein